MKADVLKLWIVQVKSLDVPGVIRTVRVYAIDETHARAKVEKAVLEVKSMRKGTTSDQMENLKLES